ncbi:MAG: acetate--CoA ligase family protein [Candidatus Eisenbacteria bacterium]
MSVLEAPAGSAPAPGWAAAVAEVIARAGARGDGRLLESDGLAMLDAVGIATPGRLLCPDGRPVEALAGRLPGERVVLKALSPDVAHKTEAGAVCVVANRADALGAAAREMSRRLTHVRRAGFLVCEFVPHETGLGHESLLGFRWTPEFGAVVTLAPGGVHAEWLARALDDAALAAVAPALAEPGDIERAVAALAPLALVTTPQRGRPAPIAKEAYVDAIRRMMALAATFCPEPLGGFEVNPLVVSGGRLVALDALCTPRLPGERPAAPRPMRRVRTLLAPRSVAVAGVSSGMNPGRIILRNLLRQGLPPQALTVIKPGAESIDGCRCVPSLAALAGPVDLLVLAVSAEQAAEMLAETCDTRRAESVILIPGGLEEMPGHEPLVRRVRESLARSRAGDWGGPVVNGGNCLGIRSLPGGVDTLFIPEHKLPAATGAGDPLALIAGSGAFAVAKTSRFGGLEPRHIVTVGNQTDLTLGDWLTHLETDAGTAVFAVYVEGFRPLDGERFMTAARRITRSGRTVVLYRAGRTAAGARAAASHTAAVAGDARLTRRLAAGAGVVVADTLEDFEDLTRLFVRLAGREPRGFRLGAVSNAGFECVVIADHLGPFVTAEFDADTRRRLGVVLERARLDAVVGVRNPIDVTPTLGDAGFAEIAGAVLDDPGVDAAVVGCVPLTPALATLPGSEGAGEDLTREGGVVPRLVELWRRSRKPWVMVVDAGSRYDPMVAALESAGVPVFRGADRALRLFARWCVARAAAGGVTPVSVA